jgi:hypothetical protein
MKTYSCRRRPRLPQIHPFATLGGLVREPGNMTKKSLEIAPIAFLDSPVSGQGTWRHLG